MYVKNKVHQYPKKDGGKDRLAISQFGYTLCHIR